MKHDYQRNQPNPEEEQVRRLQEAAAQREPTSRRRLDNESVNTKYVGNVLAHPLASKEQYSGNYEQGVSQLILIGNTVLAVSRGVNRKLIGSGRSPVDSVRVSVLPMGEQAAVGKKSSVTLFETSPSRLSESRDGIVQAWDEFEIGRDLLSDATGVRDSLVSRKHASIKVTAEGMVEITDMSTNGTQIFDEFDFQDPKHGGLGEQGRLELAAVMERLQTNPHEWDKESVGHTVITGN